MSITSAASTAVSTCSTSGGTTSVGGVGVNSVAATADHRPPFIQNSVRAATSPGLINDDSSTAVSRYSKLLNESTGTLKKYPPKIQAVRTFFAVLLQLSQGNAEPEN